MKKNVLNRLLSVIAFILTISMLFSCQNMTFWGDKAESETTSGTDNEATTPPLSDDNNVPNRLTIPIINIKTPSPAPRYYGYYHFNYAGGGARDVSGLGLSVTAQLIETLSDTYTFFGDLKQYEYHLLRMRTLKNLKCTEMTEEFYYLIPADYMTDFSVFDTFVIFDMAQFTYEHSVMYNHTKGVAEQFTLPLFGYRTYGYHLMGSNMMPFDADGNFDDRLWTANKFWIESTKHATPVNTLALAEEQARNRGGEEYDVKLLKDLSDETTNVLKQIKSFDNGLFVPSYYSGTHSTWGEVDFDARRFINGFATNEKVSIWSKDFLHTDQDSYTYTKARFTEEDMNTLPDLPSAFDAMIDAVNNKTVEAPHFKDEIKKQIRLTPGVFGWYAKTADGVIGIIRVEWTANIKYEDYYDDAYFIVEYGSLECKQVDRDELLEKLGEYEQTYIYVKEYDEGGKTWHRYQPMV